MKVPSFEQVTQPNRQPSEQQIVVQPEQQQIMQDPFNSEKYKNFSLPDVPIQYGGSVAESLLNDNEVPEEKRKKFFHIFHKDNTLTFLDENRKLSKLLNIDIWKLDNMATTPYYDYSFEKEEEFGILRNIFETKLDRAMGFTGASQKNERIVLQSQFSEQRHISEGADSNVREGFFRRLLGRK